MIKKSFIYGLTSIMLLSIVFVPIVRAEETGFTPNARSAVLIDQDTGTILFQKNMNEKLPPASITKIMTMLWIMEAIDSGQITLKDKVRTSEHAASMGGSQIFLEPGEEMTVDDLLKGIALASGNDASVAMAEYIGGSDEAFVQMMNKKAEELGLMNTHFVNSNGLPEANQYTSAYDVAIMSRELLKHERITAYTGIYQDYLRKNTSNPFWLVNTNRMVRFYDGVDGLKTGYTNEAKFCLSATAKKGSLRVIVVVMGEPNTKTRNNEVAQLLDYAFNQYKNKVLFGKNQIVTEVEVSKGKKQLISLIAPHQISLLMKKSEDEEEFEQVLKTKGDIKAPIKKGEVLGELQMMKGGNQISSISLIAAEDVEKANIWDMFKITLGKILFIDDKQEPDESQKSDDEQEIDDNQENTEIQKNNDKLEKK